MATQNTSLAVKYRPLTFEDVQGQDTVKHILQHQIETNTFKQGYLFAGQFGGGKACSLDSDILGPDGYFKMRDAKVGMKVWGEDGELHTIVGVYPQGIKEMYRIHFSDKTFTDCCIDHLWTLRKGSSQITDGPHRWFTASVRWLLAQDLWTPYRVDANGHKCNSRIFRVPVAKPLNFPKADLPVDPYLLGQLLSDGCISADNLNITISDEDVKMKVNLLLNNIGLELRQSSNIIDKNRFDYAIRNIQKDESRSKLKKTLESLDAANKSIDKHIPKQYLFSSIEQRTALLQGLFDGDGSIQSGQYTYSTSSESLYNDIKFLIQSLGGVVFVTEGKPSFRTLEDGTRQYYGLNWEFQFHLPKDIVPFSSEKHRSRYGKGSQFNGLEELVKSIDRIEKIEDAECQCIMTDNLTGLYLTNDCIVTHNTTCARIFAKMINEGKSADIIEIDAASFNGVEQIRSICEEAKKKPLVGKYKVFILDEAHMLSNAAGNAFLKILEEPPASAVFILCTTDPQKVLPTILSRVQRYDFTSIATDKIVQRLRFIADEEHIAVDDASLKFIAKLSTGSMRNAISSLDKVSSITEGAITLNDVSKALSVVSYHDHLDLLTALIDKDTKLATEIVVKVSEAGTNMKQFMNQFMWCVCDVCNQFIFQSYDYIGIPELPEYVEKVSKLNLQQCLPILDWAKNIVSVIRNDDNPKNNILVEVMLWTQS